MLTIINGVEQFSTNIIDAKLYQNKIHHPIKIIKDGVTSARRGSGRTTAGHEDAVPQPSGIARFRITTAHHLYKSSWTHRAPLCVPTGDGCDRTT